MEVDTIHTQTLTCSTCNRTSDAIVPNAHNLQVRIAYKSRKVECRITEFGISKAILKT
eukprot:m.252207 g.252207  ORF g.252207 m.252207 type:complete len:58 (+) comp19558_c0_seq3:147-320(+)